jgi:hypothetical protein
MMFPSPIRVMIPARPPEFAHLTTIATDFWRSGRRVAAASLYRLFVRPEFGGSGALDSGQGTAGYFDPHVPPAVVVQTIGTRSPGAGHHEVSPH